jgi:branched-subunit amino acid transport protein AzlD
MEMVKWLHLTHNQHLGFFALGLAFFALQQLPYIIMPLLNPDGGPIMAMTDKSAVLNAVEKVLGISCLVLLVFLVRGDAEWFSLSGTKEVMFFGIAMLAIVGYYVGWIFYWNGNQSLTLMLGTLVALPPIYYAFLGLWRGNTPLAVVGGLFLVAHLGNVWNNLRGSGL